MKKSLKFSALVISILLALSFAACKHGNNTKADDNTSTDYPAKGALKSIKAVEGVTQVYTAEFEGDYFLDDIINANLRTSAGLLSFLKSNVKTWEAGESQSPIQINVRGAACSSIVAKHKDANVGGYIYGRNFDWDPGTSLILHTKPKSGFESVSTCYLGFVNTSGTKENWAPNDNETNNLLALCCIYVPMDGMNEKGLYIANLQNDTDPVMPATGDTTKKYVQTTVAIRYILDKCAAVDDAVAWLKTINMCPVYGDIKEDGEPAYPDYHFAIADNSGKSVVVEWINGTIQVIESKIVTNHSLYNQRDPENYYTTYSRFDDLKNFGDTKNWELDVADVTEALGIVQQKHSVWSAVFEPSAKRVTYYFRKADPQAGVDQTDETAVHEAKHHPMDYTKSVVVQF